MDLFSLHKTSTTLVQSYRLTSSKDEWKLSRQLNGKSGSYKKKWIMNVSLLLLLVCFFIVYWFICTKKYLIHVQIVEITSNLHKFKGRTKKEKGKIFHFYLPNDLRFSLDLGHQSVFKVSLVSCPQLLETIKKY